LGHSVYVIIITLPLPPRSLNVTCASKYSSKFAVTGK